MWLVFTAMRRPITIIVAMISIALAAVMAVRQMKVDIFPKLGAPAIYVAQPYGGMDPSQMEGYLTYYYEYHFLYITGIEHVESKNIRSEAGRAGDLRRAAVRRHGSVADGRVSDVLLRVPLPLHHGHRARRVEEHQIGSWARRRSTSRSRTAAWIRRRWKGI